MLNTPLTLELVLRCLKPPFFSSKGDDDRPAIAESTFSSGAIESVSAIMEVRNQDESDDVKRTETNMKMINKAVSECWQDVELTQAQLGIQAESGEATYW